MNRPHTFVFVLSLLITSVAFCQSTVIKAGKLIDPRSGSVLANQMIIIEGPKQ